MAVIETVRDGSVMGKANPGGSNPTPESGLKLSLGSRDHHRKRMRQPDGDNQRKSLPGRLIASSWRNDSR
jgi:hypothetical protein